MGREGGEGKSGPGRKLTNYLPLRHLPEEGNHTEDDQ